MPPIYDSSPDSSLLDSDDSDLRSKRTTELRQKPVSELSSSELTEWFSRLPDEKAEKRMRSRLQTQQEGSTADVTVTEKVTDPGKTEYLQAIDQARIILRNCFDKDPADSTSLLELLTEIYEMVSGLQDRLRSCSCRNGGS